MRVSICRISFAYKDPIPKAMLSPTFFLRFILMLNRMTAGYTERHMSTNAENADESGQPLKLLALHCTQELTPSKCGIIEKDLGIPAAGYCIA